MFELNHSIFQILNYIFSSLILNINFDESSRSQSILIFLITDQRKNHLNLVLYIFLFLEGKVNFNDLNFDEVIEVIFILIRFLSVLE